MRHALCLVTCPCLPTIVAAFLFLPGMNDPPPPIISLPKFSIPPGPHRCPRISALLTRRPRITNGLRGGGCSESERVMVVSRASGMLVDSRGRKLRPCNYLRAEGGQTKIECIRHFWIGCRCICRLWKVCLSLEINCSWS